jgi:hypothetical protein
VDLARAVFDRRTKTLKFSMRCREGDASSRTVVIGNLPRDGLQHLRCDCVDLPIPAGHDFETFGTMDIQRQGEHIRLRCPIGRLHDFELTL